MALFVTVYMSLMGPKGLKEVNDRSSAAAHYLHDELLKTGKFEEAFDQPFLKEFALKPLEPNIPKEIRRDYVQSCDVTKRYHIGMKRFLDETKAAGVTKVRTEGRQVWYKKDELDKLFKKL